MRVRLSRTYALSVIVLAAACGCESRPETLGTLVPVKGKVTYKGKPLEKGIVRFEPDGYGRMASGNLQADGTYTLSTVKNGDGAVLGIHKVYVTGVDTRLAKDRAFKKYMQANGSTLTAEVSPESTEFNFDLK
jgi:hypothetical protein